MNAALEGGEWSAARPDRTLPPGKTRYLFFMRLGGPQGRSGRAENLVPPGFDPGSSSPYCQSMPRDIPEERRSHLQRGERPKLRK